jgi:hypothetical protein
MIHFKGRLACLGLAFLALLLLSQGAMAFSHLSYPYGERVGVYDARSLAMGQTGVAFQENAFALNLNPACLMEIRGFSAHSSVHLVKVDEDRAFPFHDSFDGFVDYNTYAMNSNVYSGFAFGVVKTFKNSPVPTVGIAGYPLYDWNYDYQEEVRDDGDLLIGRNLIENRKGIYAISLGLAEQATSWLDLGVSLNWLNGDGEFERRAFGDTVIALENQDLDVDGMNFNLGALARVTPRVRVGVAYRSEAKVDGTVKFSGKDIANPDSSRAVELTYPYSVVFGVEYRPRNDLTTRLNFDVEYARWSKFDDINDESIDFDNIWQFAGGVEHIFFRGFPARFGFRYQPSYQDKEVTTTAFTFGTGLSHRGFQIDFGGEVGTRTWRQADLFPESYHGGVERTGQDKVKESLIRAMISIGYRI